MVKQLFFIFSTILLIIPISSKLTVHTENSTYIYSLAGSGNRNDILDGDLRPLYHWKLFDNSSFPNSTYKDYNLDESFYVFGNQSWKLNDAVYFQQYLPPNAIALFLPGVSGKDEKFPGHIFIRFDVNQEDLNYIDLNVIAIVQLGSYDGEDIEKLLEDNQMCLNVTATPDVNPFLVVAHPAFLVFYSGTLILGFLICIIMAAKRLWLLWVNDQITLAIPVSMLVLHIVGNIFRIANYICDPMDGGAVEKSWQWWYISPAASYFIYTINVNFLLVSSSLLIFSWNDALHRTRNRKIGHQQGTLDIFRIPAIVISLIFMIMGFVIPFLIPDGYGIYLHVLYLILIASLSTYYIVSATRVLSLLRNNAQNKKIKEMTWKILIGAIGMVTLIVLMIPGAILFFFRPGPGFIEVWPIIWYLVSLTIIVISIPQIMIFGVSPNMKKSTNTGSGNITS